MRREHFEHVVRAAAAILGTDEILIIGSQAVHGSVDGPLPPEAERSVEIDVVVFGDEDGSRADLVDGAIGEASMFHATFGYYAHGVVESTATLPEDWRERLVPFRTAATEGVTAYCLDLHDLWISKAIAHRPKDIEFCRALLRSGLVKGDVLAERLTLVSHVADELCERIKTLITETGDERNLAEHR